MSAFTESVSGGLSDLSQDSPLLSDDSAIAWRPSGFSQKVTVILVKTLYPQQFQGSFESAFNQDVKPSGAEWVWSEPFDMLAALRRTLQPSTRGSARVVVSFGAHCLSHSKKRHQSKVLEPSVSTRGSKSTTICHTAQPK